MKMIKFVFFMLLAVLMVSCSNPAGNSSNDSEDVVETKTTTPESPSAPETPAVPANPWIETVAAEEFGVSVLHKEPTKDFTPAEFSEMKTVKGVEYEWCENNTSLEDYYKLTSCGTDGSYELYKLEVHKNIEYDKFYIKSGFKVNVGNENHTLVYRVAKVGSSWEVSTMVINHTKNYDLYLEPFEVTF